MRTSRASMLGVRKLFICDIGRYRCDENHQVEVIKGVRESVPPGHACRKSPPRYRPFSIADWRLRSGVGGARSIGNWRSKMRCQDADTYERAALGIPMIEEQAHVKSYSLSNAEQYRVTRGDRGRGVFLPVDFAPRVAQTPPRKAAPKRGGHFFCSSGECWAKKSPPLVQTF